MNVSFIPFPVICTKRLDLREVTKMDRHEILFLRSDQEVNKFIKIQAPKSLEDADLFLDKITKEIKNNELIYWGLSLKNKPKMIGSICLWNFSMEGKKAEVGYALNPAFQNLGLMSEALEAVLVYGFKTLQLDEIEAFTSFENENSIKLLKKFKFNIIAGKKDKNNANNIVLSIKNKNEKR